MIKNLSKVMQKTTRTKRSGFDRRSTEDMRKVYKIDYFSEGGTERRSMKERRQLPEQRSGWCRTNKWSSVIVDNPVLL